MKTDRRPDARIHLGGSLFLAATLVAPLALPAPAAAKSAVLPDTLAVSPARSGPRGSWWIFTGEPSADTLQVPVRAAFRSAFEALGEDSWVFHVADASAGRIVTRWKPLRHILVRLFAGRVDARCYVWVAPLGARGSIVTFQGALATKHSLEGNPILPFAKKTYRKESGDWHDEVRNKVGLEPFTGKHRSRAK